MKRFLHAAIAAGVALCLALACARATAADAFAQAARMGRGINILGGDPIWQRPRQGAVSGAPFCRHP